MNARLPCHALMEREDLGSPAWWDEVRAAGTPLRRALPDGQVELTFLWRDPAGGALQSDCRRVYLDVYSHTPHPSQQLTSMERLADSDAWMWRTSLPADWRGSYFLMPADSTQQPPAARGEVRAWWIRLMESKAMADPLNPVPPHGGGWGLPLSAIRLPGAHGHPAWLALPGSSPGLPPAAPAGRLREQRWASRRLCNERQVWQYRTGTADHADARTTHAEDLPLVLLLDGHYWARQMPVFPALDAMTAVGELPPALYVLIDAIGPEHRTRELPCNPAFWMAVQEELLPELRTLGPFTSDPRRTVVAGQSFGGLSALYAALRWPQRYGRVLSQSGSFWWPESDPGQRGGWLARELRAGLCRSQALEVDMEVGCYEDDMKIDNRAMRDALAASGHRVHYGEFRGGHDWYCWRDGLLQGLARLLNNLPEEQRP